MLFRPCARPVRRRIRLTPVNRQLTSYDPEHVHPHHDTNHQNGGYDLAIWSIKIFHRLDSVPAMSRCYRQMTILIIVSAYRPGTRRGRVHRSTRLRFSCHVLVTPPFSHHCADRRQRVLHGKPGCHSHRYRAASYGGDVRHHSREPEHRHDRLSAGARRLHSHQRLDCRPLRSALRIRQCSDRVHRRLDSLRSEP